ncbi:MAG: hypothetical protein H7A53_01170 [Akkermansiaceae bacterium]|nr:hypothetical protein [Akkermansiaceae bacterium]MCP5549496.1 hypothetical protein [Akkermansiaceae bacterium]
MRYLGQPSFILGFHGCDSEVASAVINGKGHLLESRNSHDWLGHGIYFWENDPERALKWAENRMKRPDSRIKNPDVVGAIIDLGYCLSLLESTHIRLIEAAYSVLKERHDSKGTKMPVNTGGDDLFRRGLDCAVIQTLAEIQSSQGRGFDTVRGLFREGSEPYPTAGFRRGNHIQVCVRNHEAIKGSF